MKQIKIKQSQKGYTLIEVLLVVVLIGILLTIGLVSLNTEARFIENRNDTRKSHIRILEGAITQYKLQTGSYPTGLDRTYREICDPDVSSCSGFVDLKQFLVPNYLQAIPQDPKDTDNTGGAGYEVAIDTTTNTVSVRLKELLREGGVIIAVNDPLPAESTTTANSSLAATVPVTPPQLPIVTNGLVLNLDAGNRASYPGTGNGNTWFDLSGNGNNGTLVNGVGYNSANGGSLVFDGTNDRVTISNTIPSLSNFTIELFMQTSLLDGSQDIFFDQFFSLRFEINSNKYRIHLGSGSRWAFITHVGNTTLSTNTWYHSVWSWNGTTSALYLNGVSDGTMTYSAASSGTGDITLGQHTPDTSYNWNGRISNIRIYNRALTASEIQQNFNATRGRFGL